MDALEKDQIKFKFTLIMMNWIRLNTNADEQNQFPLDIVQLIIDTFLYENILQFNEEFSHPEVVLDDNKRLATARKRCCDSSSYVMIDCDPVKSGIYVWRIQV